MVDTQPNHSFYVPKHGWTSAIKLRAGDILVLSNGEYVVVEVVQHEILESPVKVYNFEVEDFHTYFVGRSSVLVHNDCTHKIDYKKVFFDENPDLEGKVVVHHSIEQQVLKRYPGLFTPEEINSYEMLRGIPKDINSDVHLSKIRIAWNEFYKKVDAGDIPLTKESFLDQAKKIDDLYGSQFNPPF